MKVCIRRQYICSPTQLQNSLLTYCCKSICRLRQLLLHIAITYFMSFGVILVLGLLLELRSRRCFLMSTKCGELQWQPSGFAAVLSDTVTAIMRPFSAAPAARQCSSAKECSSSSCCRPSEAISAAYSGTSYCSSTMAGPSAGPSAPGCCSGQSSAAGGRGRGNGCGLPPNNPCGVESIEHVEACQRLLDDRNELAKKQRLLQQKCVISNISFAMHSKAPGHCVALHVSGSLS